MWNRKDQSRWLNLVTICTPNLELLLFSLTLMSSYLRVNSITPFIKGVSYQLYLYLDNQLKVLILLLLGGFKDYL